MTAITKKGKVEGGDVHKIKLHILMIMRYTVFIFFIFTSVRLGCLCLAGTS